MPAYKIGIDVGGTKIEGIILDQSDRTLFRRRMPTEQERGYDHILTSIHSLYTMMLSRIAGADHTVGIGTPGAISRKTGLLKNSNTECFNGKPVREDLAGLFGRNIAVENDANCFALAETMMGAVIGNELVFGIIMGTGCGGGIVHHGTCISGLQAIAGEWGHMTIDPNGPACWCGLRGCVETVISGGGLQKLYHSRYGERLELPAIIEKYRAGEPDASSFMSEFFTNFGRATANVINILDPDIIVLGGGVSNCDELYSTGAEQVRRFVFTDSFDTPIVKNQLGDSAGVIGAAFVGAQEC
ncbi:MAG: ROK family protein [Chitinivibrionales bacterium]|nr:ROK family protein [Chitinivibrionales bacterium]